MKPPVSLLVGLCALAAGCDNATDCRLVARAYEAQSLEQTLAEEVPAHEGKIVDALQIQGATPGTEYARAYRLCTKEYR